jgi:hypothetical protein
MISKDEICIQLDERPDLDHQAQIKLVKRVLFLNEQLASFLLRFLPPLENMLLILFVVCHFIQKLY